MAFLLGPGRGELPGLFYLRDALRHAFIDDSTRVGFMQNDRRGLGAGLFEVKAGYCYVRLWQARLAGEENPEDERVGHFFFPLISSSISFISETSIKQIKDLTMNRPKERRIKSIDNALRNTSIES